MAGHVDATRKTWECPSILFVRLNIIVSSVDVTLTPISVLGTREEVC